MKDVFGVPLSIWRFTDGKRGHENQTGGLVEALCRKTTCRVETLATSSGWRYIVDWLLGRFPQGRELARPDLLIGAGHATHWPLLAARRAHGGKVVVLMKPSLPIGWFDRVIAPEHDHLAARPNLLTTRGPINRVAPNASKNASQGLMLIGGPTSEYGWNETALLKQIHLIALHQPEVEWHLTTSRRTPRGLVTNVAGLRLANIRPVAYDDVGADWLPEQLADAAQVWVTPDSASMVYEALTSGAAVGCFELPFLKPGRVARGLQELAREGLVTEFSEWERLGNLKPNAHPLNEAERCADEILKWLKRS